MLSGTGAEEGGQGGGLGLQVVSSRAAMDELNDLRLSDGASAAMGALVCVEKGAHARGGGGSKGGFVLPEGTPNYMPAEVVRYGKYSDKSDIWALGLTILECLTGERGYPYTNPQTTIFQVACVARWLLSWVCAHGDQ